MPFHLNFGHGMNLERILHTHSRHRLAFPFTPMSMMIPMSMSAISYQLLRIRIAMFPPASAHRRRHDGSGMPTTFVNGGSVVEDLKIVIALQLIIAIRAGSGPRVAGGRRGLRQAGG